MLRKVVATGLAAILITSFCAACDLRSGASQTAGTRLLTQTPCDKWQAIDISNGGGETGVLTSLAFVQSSDIWVSGSLSTTDRKQAVFHHWNGTAWQVVSSPNGDGYTNISAMSAVNHDDVWAVGTVDQGLSAQTFIVHWDGRSWHQVPSPNPGTTESRLSSVTMNASNDGRAVGYYKEGGEQYKLLIIHWDGRSWSKVLAPQIASSKALLLGVTSLASNNAWAVGKYEGDGELYIDNPLVLHWDGQAWQRVSITNTVKGVSLYAVTSVSSTDLWAVGEYYSNTPLGAIMHWDGKSWNTIYGDNAANGGLYGVTAISKDNVWAVGYRREGPYQKPTVRHWNGSSWSDVPSPTPLAENGFNGVIKDADSGVWAVGQSFKSIDDPEYGLIAHFTGTPCPAATSTPTSKP